MPALLVLNGMRAVRHAGGAAVRVRWNHYTERNVIERNDLWVCSSSARAPSALLQRGVSKRVPLSRELPLGKSRCTWIRVRLPTRAEAGAGLGVRGWNERKDHGDEPAG